MDKVLLVDDEPSVLDALKRQFRKQFQLFTAVGGEEGLEKITAEGPFSVVVSDCKMPRMNGIEFLARVRSLSPDSVRMMLTGNNDLDTAMEAVNQGEIFRFLTKPCPPETFKTSVEAAIKQYRLLRAEKELLEQTLTGSLKALADVLSLYNPEAFARAARVKRYALGLAKEMGVPEVWDLEIAATLSQIGYITLPKELLQKKDSGQPLTPDEMNAFSQYPEAGRNILGNIPRMEDVADIIHSQHKHFDGSGLSEDARKGDAIPLGARLLKVALDFDELRMQEVSKSEAFAKLEIRTGWYDPKILDTLREAFVPEQQYKIVSISLSELQPNMVLADGICDIKGQLLVGKGQDLSEWMVTRLKQMTGNQAVQEPIQILVQELLDREMCYV